MSASLLSIGSRSLAAAQAALGTISHNIANVNTAGYSRQETVQSTAASQFTGGGFFGQGVDVATVRRQYDQFLVSAVQANTSQASADSARSSALQELDDLFANADLGMGAAIDDVFGAAGDVANRPSDMAARQAFLARIDQMADRFASMGSQLEGLGKQTNERITHAVTQVNASLTEIRKLNAQITAAKTSGHSPNDLLDRRDNAMQGLQQWVSVTGVVAADGTLNVFGTQGEAFLVGNQQADLQVIHDSGDASKIGLQLKVGVVVQRLNEGAIGGAIGGLIRFRDEDLAATKNSLGLLAVVIAEQFNSRQAAGVDAAGAPGRALLSVPLPEVRPNSRNIGAGVLSATIADSIQLKASDYRVEWNGTAYTITRLVDGQTTNTAMVPATVDGLTFTMTGTPGTGDVYAVMPYSKTVSGIQANALLPKELATAFAAMVEMAPSNSGSVQASRFEVVRQSADTALPVAITFNDPPTTFNITGLATGDVMNIPYVSGDQIPSSPADYNGWVISLSGTPAAGDSLAIRKTIAPGNDNRNMRVFNDLASRATIDGATMNEAYATIIGGTGTRVQGARDAAAISAQFLESAIARKEGLSGVNLDEEAANLLRYQQAYQASAKIIQASQSVFDALLSAVGR